MTFRLKRENGWWKILCNHSWGTSRINTEFMTAEAARTYMKRNMPNYKEIETTPKQP